jgi:1,6-anhydro-N-acetylmuramate kinase
VIAGLARELGVVHVTAIRELLAGERADLISAHGQTVFHAPPLSWQLFSSAPVAHALGTPVVFDLRAADLAAGGQGAPITPLADYVLFRDASQTRAVVNFGGFCNFTLLPRGAAIASIRGGDVCACNQLLNALARAFFNEPFDADGRHARQGRICNDTRDELVELLRRQARAGRSLGTGDELTEWLTQQHSKHPAENLACSACDAIAQVIVETVDRAASAARAAPIDAWVLAGGGVRNRALYEAFAKRCVAPVTLSDTYGVPATHREAAAIAVLGALSQDRVPITLPAITGAAIAPLAGTWVLP